jgi:hypothetical protein
MKKETLKMSTGVSSAAIPTTNTSETFTALWGTIRRKEPVEVNAKL